MKATKDLAVGDVIYSKLKIDANKTKALGISKAPTKTPVPSAGGTLNIEHPMVIVEKDAATNTAKGVLLTSQKTRHNSLTADQKACLTDAAHYIHNPTKPSYVLPEVFHLRNPNEVCIPV